ncbi:MAG TPA: imidazole glycerol phosphate synthase subunit HisH [Methylomirabilota bacterium]|nr:imidazole glycerol phosphate synthase subunit HisH [Methylomirabilota bacterium]
MTEVVLVRTGTANLASVAAALGRAGCAVRLTESGDDLASAERLVLPGVGAFGAVAERLDALGLREPLAERLRAGRPTLAVCLGLQLLAEASDESPGAHGLGVIKATVTALPEGVRRPQLGWNRVAAGPGCRLLTDGVAYFANSYKLDAVPDGWSGAVTDHGGPFVAALERGAVLACQFHPELSGPWGQALVERWLAAAGEVA